MENVRQSRDLGDRERCLDAGADEHVPKPASLHQLADLLREKIGRAVPQSHGRTPPT